MRYTGTMTGPEREGRLEWRFNAYVLDGTPLEPNEWLAVTLDDATFYGQYFGHDEDGSNRPSMLVFKDGESTGEVMVFPPEAATVRRVTESEALAKSQRPQDYDRVAKSIANVEAARRLLARASEELSPVPGYAEEWTAINDAWRNVGELSDLLEARGYEIARHTLRLDADDGGGPRYNLGEKPVHAGTELEVLLDDEWIAVRFEWTHRLDDLPLLYRDDGGSIPLPESSESNLVLFRWPHTEAP